MRSSSLQACMTQICGWTGNSDHMTPAGQYDANLYTAPFLRTWSERCATAPTASV